MAILSDAFLAICFAIPKKQPVDKPVPNATLQVTGAVGWRREGLAYKKNEVFVHLLFIIERMCAFVHLVRMTMKFSKFHGGRPWWPT